MPSLLYYLHRAAEQPFRETLNQARSLAACRARAVLQPTYDRVFRRNLSKETILELSGFPSAAQLASELKTRQWPQLPLQSEGAVESANLVSLRPWHTDLRSGYEWNPATHYRQIRLTPGPGVDIKVPWELSRCHHLVVLGQAYKITKEEKYAEEFTRQVLDWIRQNPCRFGVNWVNAMEAGIRAVNWLWAFYFTRESTAVDDSFVLEFLTSLRGHADFIRSNLEYREAFVRGRRRRLNSNHYLCHLVGLLSIGLLLPELKLANQAEFAVSELEMELLEQTTADGVDYEHSTSYHRFVVEIFQYAFLLIEWSGYEVKPALKERLRRMEEFLAACRHPDGTLPQIGDNDSGRLLPGFGAVQPPVSRHSAAFQEAGFYTMRGVDSHVIISAARGGMLGLGSHSHNDLLSFEYWYGGQAWIVDPGTFVYLANRDARNWFRSTAAHNTVRVDGEEINPFHPEAIFQMVDQAEVTVGVWNAGDTVDVLEVEHNGYMRLKNPVRHRRRFELEKQTACFIIQDAVEGAGTHLFEWFFQIHPAVHVESNDASFILSMGSHRIRLRITCNDCAMMPVPGWYSPSYGIRQPATTVVALLTAQAPVSARIVIEPC